MLADPRDYSLATFLFTELFNVVVLRLCNPKYRKRLGESKSENKLCTYPGIPMRQTRDNK